MKKSMLGTAAILLATLFWGMTFSFIKDAVNSLSPFNFLFWRFGIASVLLVFIFRNAIKLNDQIIFYGMLLGLFLAGTVIFQTIGLRYTTASSASFITGLSVIIVALLESILNRKWPSITLMFSALLAVVGVGFITLSTELVVNQGDIWVLLCAFCFASYILFAGIASHIHQTVSLTFVQSIFVCILAGSLCFFEDRIVLPQYINVWVAILFCSIFASIIAFLLQLQYQKYISSTKAAIIFSLEPVFATITAAIYLDERISLQFVIGAVMIFFAIWFSEKRVKQKTIPQE